MGGVGTFGVGDAGVGDGGSLGGATGTLIFEGSGVWNPTGTATMVFEGSISVIRGGGNIIFGGLGIPPVLIFKPTVGFIACV